MDQNGFGKFLENVLTELKVLHPDEFNGWAVLTGWDEDSWEPSFYGSHSYETTFDGRGSNGDFLQVTFKSSFTTVMDVV